MSGTDRKAKQSGKTRRPRSWKRLIFRSSLRFLVVLLLLIAGVTVFVSFTPVSAPWMNETLRQRWLEATGLELDYSHAELTLATGLVDLTGPSLIDPESGEPLISVSSFEVRISLPSIVWAVLRGDQAVQIRRITVQGPLDLHFEERSGRFGLSPRLRRLYTIISGKLESKQDDGEDVRVDIGSIMLSDVDLYLDRVTEEEHVRLASIRETFLLTEFERGRSLPSNINLVGKLVGEQGSTGLTLQLSPNDAEEELALKLRVNPLNSRSDFLSRLPMDFQTGEIVAGGLLRRQGPGDWMVSLQGSAPHVILVGAGVHGVDHRFEDAAFETSVRWRNEEKGLEILIMDLHSRDSTLLAGGTVQLFDPYRYELDLKKLELRGQAVSLAERTIFGENRITKPDEGRLHATGKVYGTATDLRPDQIEGNFGVDDLTLSLPSLHEPVQAVSLQATITPDRVEITEGGAWVQGLPVSVTGAMQGRPLDGAISNARFDWRVAGELSGLNELLKTSTEEMAQWDIGFGGDVSGGGTVEVSDLELEHWGEVFERARIEGRLVFNDGEIRTNQVNPPIRKVRGTFQFDRRRAEFSNFSGELDSLTFTMSGALQGEKSFWEAPRLDAEVDTQFRLENLASMFAWFDQEPPDLPTLSGTVRLAGRLKTPLNELELASMTGSIDATNVRLHPEGPHFGETIHFPTLKASLDAHRITLENTLGKWGEMNLELQGSFAPDGGTIQTQLNGDLASIPPLIPRVGNRFDHLGGSVSVLSQIDVARREGAPELLNLVEVLRELETAPNESTHDPEASPTENSWIANLGGEIKLDGAQLLYETMPSNSHLTDIYGVLKFNEQRCWSEEPVFLVPGIGADTAETTVLIDYEEKEQRELRLDFDLRGTNVDLDNWVNDWRKKKPRVRLESDRKRKHLPFYLNVDAESDRILYRGMQGTDFSARIELKSPVRGRFEVDWKNARASFEEGKASVQGRIEREGEHRRITHEIEGEDLQLADVSRAFLKNPESISSGRISGRLNIETEGPKGTPYQGSGTISVSESRFVSNAIFRGVGRILKLDTVFNDISFTQISGDFRIADNRVIIARNAPLVFENPSALHPLSMKASGEIGGNRDTDLQLSLQFFPVVGNIPLIGSIWNALTGRIIRMNVRGPAEDPKVSMGAPVV